MKNLFLYLILLIFCCLNIAKAQNFDFRKTNWGMSYEKVKASEKSKIVQDKKNVLVYSATLADLPCNVYYYFGLGDKLNTGKYQIVLEDADASSCVAKYNYLSNLLTIKYNKPVSVKQLWAISDIDKDTSNWIPAIVHNDLALATIWHTAKTTCNLTVFNFLNKVYIQIEYMSNKYKEIDNKEILQKVLDDL